jgi:hypothetical protein
MAIFNEGDIVRLKCGGPELAVLATLPAFQYEDGFALAVLCVLEDPYPRRLQAYPPYALDPVQIATVPYERRRYDR